MTPRTLPFFALLAPLFACEGEHDSGADTSSGAVDTADTSGSGDTADSADSADDAYGAAALAFVETRLVGAFSGDWQLYGTDASDQPVESYAWTDVISATNPRSEENRALVDISDEMDGGRWQQTVTFNEGVYISEDNGVGDYFMEMDGVITILTEVEPDRWEYSSELTENDLALVANLTEENYRSGYKVATKLVTWVDGWERHDVSVLTHVEYAGTDGSTQVVEFTSLLGYHQKYE